MKSTGRRGMKGAGDGEQGAEGEKRREGDGVICEICGKHQEA